MWRYVECTCTMNPGRRWRCSVYLSNTWNQSPYKEVWHRRGLKSLIIMLWKPQKPKIHYLLYTTWQSKSLHYKTFNNTTDLTFYSNKIISLHIEAQNIIAQTPKIWPSGEHRQTHNQCMHFSLPTIQIFILKSHWHRWWLSSAMGHLGIQMLNWSMVNVSQYIEHPTASKHSTIQQIWPSTVTK